MSHDPDKNLFPNFWELDLFMHQSLSLKDDELVLPRFKNSSQNV